LSGADFIRDPDIWHRRCADVIDSINNYSIGDSTGSANAYVLTLRTPHFINRYLDNQRFNFVPNFTSTSTTPTANVNSVGAKTIKRADGSTALTAGDLISGVAATIEYDSSADCFRLISSPGSPAFQDLAVVSGGSSNAYTITNSQLPAANVTGQIVHFFANHTNTATATLAVNGATAKTIKKASIPGGALVTLDPNDIISGAPFIAMYDGTDYLLLNPVLSDIQSWTPTLSQGGAMTWTSTSIDKARYFRQGRKVFFTVKVTGTTGGVASADLSFTLPVTAQDTHYGGGGLALNTGTRQSCHWTLFSTSAATVTLYDASNWALGANTGFTINGWYEGP